MYKTTLKIDGMMCSMCEAHINDVIRKNMKEAKKVSSSHSKGISTFETETLPDLDGLKKAISRFPIICNILRIKHYSFII